MLVSAHGFHTDQQISFYLQRYFAWSIISLFGGMQGWFICMANSHANNNHLSQTMRSEEWRVSIRRHCIERRLQALFKGRTTLLKALVTIHIVWTCVEWLKFLVNRCKLRWQLFLKNIILPCRKVILSHYSDSKVGVCSSYRFSEDKN